MKQMIQKWLGITERLDQMHEVNVTAIPRGITLALMEVLTGEQNGFFPNDKNPHDAFNRRLELAIKKVIAREVDHAFLRLADEGFIDRLILRINVKQVLGFEVEKAQADVPLAVEALQNRFQSLLERENELANDTEDTHLEEKALELNRVISEKNQVGAAIGILKTKPKVMV